MTYHGRKSGRGPWWVWTSGPARDGRYVLARLNPVGLYINIAIRRGILGFGWCVGR